MSSRYTRSKSAEVRVEVADKTVPVELKPTRNPEKPVAPVIPPRPTVEALANAKFSTRSGYVDVDLSGCHTPLQVKDDHTVTYAVLSQRSPLSSSRETPQGAAQRGNATTTQGATRAPAENSISSAQGLRPPTLYTCKKSGDRDKQKHLSRSLPRPGRTVPQVVNGDWKVTIINSKEADQTRASLASRITKSSTSDRISANTKSVYDSILSRPPRPQVAPTGATSLRPYGHHHVPRGQSHQNDHRNPPKHHTEKPMPLPRNKLLTQSQQLTPPIAISRQQREADIAQYDYVDFKPRHVIVPNKSANTNLSTERQSGMTRSRSADGIYTALAESTLEAYNEYTACNSSVDRDPELYTPLTEQTLEGENVYTQPGNGLPIAPLSNNPVPTSPEDDQLHIYEPCEPFDPRLS